MKEFHRFPRVSQSVLAGSGSKSRSAGSQGQASSHSEHGPRDGSCQARCSKDTSLPS